MFKKLFAAARVAGLTATPAFADTLYEQEGTTEDGPAGIDASGQAPSGADASSNWKYQYGSGSTTAVYSASDGWEEISSSGDMNVEVEADIEMYLNQTISNNKVYFHIGNIYNADTDDLTAEIDGTLSSNNGQYVGISFSGQNKTESDFEKDGNGDYTGKIIGGMQSDNDTWRSQDNQMDIRFTMTWGEGYRPPDNYGDGSHGTVTDTLWWLVDEGAPGSYNLTWKVELLPEPDQPDGDYYLDPLVVAMPAL